MNYSGYFEVLDRTRPDLDSCKFKMGIPLGEVQSTIGVLWQKFTRARQQFKKDNGLETVDVRITLVQGDFAQSITIAEDELFPYARFDPNGEQLLPVLQKLIREIDTAVRLHLYAAGPKGILP